MYKEENLTPAEKALESTLGQLKPIANTMNRDVLMFNAGRASAGRKYPWQILSGALTILLLCSILIRPDLNEVQSLPSGPEPSQLQIAQIQYNVAKAAFSHDSLAYTILREDIIRYGLDALQFRQGTGQSEPIKDRKQLLESMLSL